MPLRKYFNLTHTGFTLIEIVVVTSMVGILTGILVLALNPDVFSEESQDTASKATLTKLAEQIEVYRTTENAYPVDSNGDGSVMDEGLGTFLNQWPSNSPQGTTYDYTSNGTSYALKVNKKNNTGCYVYCSLTGVISDYAGNCASVDASCAVSFAPMATPTISVTPTATVTVSPTPSVTPTATVTVSPTPSITPTATVTISPTPTPSPTATLTVFPSVVVSECYVRGCNSELCTNDPGLQSTCGPQSLEMICLAQAVCEVQPFTGLCGWTYTPEYFACTGGSGGCQSGAC